MLHVCKIPLHLLTSFGVGWCPVYVAVVGSRAQAPLGDSRFCANENLHVLSRVGERPERIIASLYKKADMYRQSEPSQMLVRVASM